jgi:MFS family permease
MRPGDAAPATTRLALMLFFIVETVARSLLLAIIPLDLLSHLGSTQRVTVFYTVVAIFGLGNSIIVPLLLARFGPRQIVIAASLLTITGYILMSTESTVGIAVGLVIRVFASACIEIPVVAYLMERIPRPRLGAFEGTRVFFQSSGFAIAPWLGFQLYQHVDQSVPFMMAAAGGATILWLALTVLPHFCPQPDRGPLSANPSIAFGRFFRQPRLRLAWLLAVVRSAYWAIFFIYAPLFAVTCGWSPGAAAGLLSLGTATLFSVAIWGKLARRIGVRLILMAGYGLTGLCLLLTAVAAIGTPDIAPWLLVASAFMACIVDGAGNTHFLRATRPHDRPAMAGIYLTYRDVSQFIPIAVFSLVLLFLPLAFVFFIFAIALFAASALSHFIHPRLR